jgi:hypothetical protein
VISTAFRWTMLTVSNTDIWDIGIMGEKSMLVAGKER